MAMTPEARVKAKVKKILDAAGVYHFSPQSGIYGRSGIPDLIGCHAGRFLAIECKAGSNKPTALQEKEMQKVRGAGGTALWVNEDNIDSVRQELILLGA